MYDFRTFRKVADKLAQIDKEEYYRSAISRYYYSLFGCARLYLMLTMGEYQFARGRDVHQRMCNRLINSDDETERALGAILDKLKGLRNLADYDWDKKDCEFFKDNLFYVKRESERGLEQVESLKQSPPYDL